MHLEAPLLENTFSRMRGRSKRPLHMRKEAFCSMAGSRVIAPTPGNWTHIQEHRAK